MKHLDLKTMSLTPEVRTELELMMASKKQILAAMKRDPEVALQFLKDIGLLDADGNRVVLPGEEHLHFNGHGTANGDSQ